MAEKPSGNILVLGFGSEVLSDDGLPLKIVKDLKRLVPAERISYRTSPTGGMELCELLDGFEAAVLLDTVRTMKGRPGELHILEYPAFMESFHLSSQHDITFEEALRLGKQLEFNMPSKIIQVAIEISENRLLRESFSEVMQQNYPIILDQIITLIRDFI